MILSTSSAVLFQFQLTRGFGHRCALVDTGIWALVLSIICPLLRHFMRRFQGICCSVPAEKFGDLSKRFRPLLLIEDYTLLTYGKNLDHT